MVSRNRILSHNLTFYTHLRDWIIRSAFRWLILENLQGKCKGIFQKQWMGLTSLFQLDQKYCSTGICAVCLWKELFLLPRYLQIGHTRPFHKFGISLSAFSLKKGRDPASMWHFVNRRTEMSSYRTGRMLEYTWHIIFGETPILPALPECELLFCSQSWHQASHQKYGNTAHAC